MNISSAGMSVFQNTSPAFFPVKTEIFTKSISMATNIFEKYSIKKFQTLLGRIFVLNSGILQHKEVYIFVVANGMKMSFSCILTYCKLH